MVTGEFRAHFPLWDDINDIVCSMHVILSSVTYSTFYMMYLIYFGSEVAIEVSYLT